MLHSLFHSFVTVYFLRATVVTWEGVGWQQSQRGEIFNGWLLRVTPLESKMRARAFDAETLLARAREVDVFAGNRIPGCRNFLFSVLTEIRDWKVTNEKKNHPSDNFFVWGPFFWSKIKQKEINRQCWVCNVQITRRRWCPGTRRRRWTTPTRPTPFQTSGSRCRRKCLRPSRKSRHRLRRRPEQLRRPFHLR